MLENIFLVENLADASGLLEFLKSKPIDEISRKVIALDIRARFFLKRNGIETADTVPYFGSDVQKRALLRISEIEAAILAHWHFDYDEGLAELYRDSNQQAGR